MSYFRKTMLMMSQSFEPSVDPLDQLSMIFNAIHSDYLFMGVICRVLKFIRITLYNPLRLEPPHLLSIGLILLINS